MSRNLILVWAVLALVAPSGVIAADEIPTDVGRYQLINAELLVPTKNGGEKLSKYVLRIDTKTGHTWIMRTVIQYQNSMPVAVSQWVLVEEPISLDDIRKVLENQ